MDADRPEDRQTDEKLGVERVRQEYHWGTKTGPRSVHSPPNPAYQSTIASRFNRVLNLNLTSGGVTFFPRHVCCGWIARTCARY